MFIFGGAFDPPHQGHLEAIQDIAQSFSPKRIWLVPTFQSKAKNIITPFKHRLTLTEYLAQTLRSQLNSCPIEASSIEQELNATYTYQLLQGVQERKNEFGSKPTLVIGSDQFKSLQTWGQFPHFLSLCNWLILVRKPETLDQLHSNIQIAHLEGWLGQSSIFQFFEVRARAISSSEIREFFARKDNLSLRTHLNEFVLSYIERNHLYGT